MREIQILVPVLVVMLASCGGDSEGLIDTPSVVGALRAAGYREVSVSSNVDAMKEAARRFPEHARDPLDVDLIFTESSSPFTGTIATRLPSVELAKRRHRTDQPLLEAKSFETILKDPELRESLPSDYNAAKLHEARVCNVVVTSYLDHAADQARFEEAIERLRRACD